MALRETDIRTGLHTPGFLVAFGAREMSFAREYGYPVSLVSFRISYPQETGEADRSAALKELGEIVRREAGEACVVARAEENEIAVLIPGMCREKASRIAESVKASAALPVVYGIATAKAGEIGFPELWKSSRAAIEKALSETG